MIVLYLPPFRYRTATINRRGNFSMTLQSERAESAIRRVIAMRQAHWPKPVF
jgi:hypothetical protein